MNSVANIKSLTDVGKVTEAVRTELKKLGPPRPPFLIAQQTLEENYKIYHEKFNTKFYELAEWLCGCPRKSALFCYICLVMDDGDTNKLQEDWVMFGVTQGITSVYKLQEKVNEHRTTSQHMTFSLRYALLGEKSALHHLKDEFFLSVANHNEKVRVNRYLLSKLINCVKFTMGESDYNAEMRQVLKDNISLVSDVFLDSFYKIWNELLNSIHAVCVNLIQQEIEQTDFVSVEVDEVNSVGAPVMLVFIVRYELQGEIHERFLKYIITQSNHILNMPHIILCEFDKLAVFNKIPENFISISYNGLAPIFASRTGIHSRLKTYFKKIYFIHSYAHEMDFVIERTGCLDKELQIFFINLKSFQAFFSQRNGKFKTEWNFQGILPTVLTLYSHKSDIHGYLDQIIVAEVQWSTIAETVALKNLLDDVDFNYWLDFFSKLLPICNELFSLVQKCKAFDAAQVGTIVENFKTKMHHVKNGIIPHMEVNPTPSKRPCIGEVLYIKEEINDEQPDGSAKQDLREITRAKIAIRVFNVIMLYIEQRVAPSPFLLLSSIIHPGFFTQYRLAFPRTEVEQFAKLFSLDKEALTTELQIIYERDEFSQAESVLFLLHFLYKNDLTGIFSEVCKLLKMVCTVPIKTSEPGRCFNTLKRIKSFLKSPYGREKLDVLTMCLLEKDLMKKTQNFNELVIEHLCCQKTDVDVSCFTFRQLF